MNLTPYDIIIPIYNGYEYLDPLFKSLMNGTNTPHRLIIINDCSPDHQISDFLATIAKYKNNFCKEIIIHHNINNLGFIKSINFGYTLTKNNFVILNTDTEVPSNWLQCLMNPMERNKNIASITPLTNSGTICSFPNWLENNELAFGLSLQQINNTLQDINDQCLIEAPTGVGFCMALKREVVEEIGLFDAETFGLGYGEENDWCMRAKAAGYKNILIRNLYVYHKHGGSFADKKAKLIHDNYAKLLNKHPNYETEVQSFIATQPMKLLFNSLAFKLYLMHRPAIIFCHNWGGGSDHFINEHLYDDSNNTRIILIRGSSFENNVEFIEQKKSIFKLTIKTVDDILDILSKSNASKYYINHLIHFDNLPNNIDKFIHFFNKIKIKPVYYLHDYFFICPTINLMNADRKYCGLPNDMHTCNQCLIHNKEFIHLPLASNINMQLWREKFGNLLNIISKIYVFSNCSMRLLVAAYPQLIDKIKFYNLRLTKSFKSQANFNFHKHKKIKVGVLGAIQYLKGLDLIQQNAMISHELNLPIEFIVIGYTAKAVKYIEVTGKYNKTELAKICLNKAIDLFVIPSIWPETYCYTADEIMNLGYPLICFNIGAPAERVINYQHGFIVDNLDPISLLNQIIIVAEQYDSNLFSTLLKEKIKNLSLDFTQNSELDSTQNNYNWKIINSLRLIRAIVKKIKTKFFN